MAPFIIAAIVLILSGLRIAQEYERSVVFRLGRYKALKGPGLYWLIPLGIERQITVDMRTVTVTVEQQGNHHQRQCYGKDKRGAVV